MNPPGLYISERLRNGSVQVRRRVFNGDRFLRDEFVCVCPWGEAKRMIANEKKGALG